jgi:beta-mannosidase
MKNWCLLLMVTMISACGTGPAAEQWVDLGGEWTFGRTGEEERWTAEVPGTVHTDLMRHGLIPDPYRSTNEDSVQWVGERDWTYVRRFDASAALLEQEEVELVFKGLDTFAEVWLNGQRLGTADNMFRSWVFRVKGLLREQGNQLEVRFTSPIKRGAELLQQYGRSLPADNDIGTVKVSPFVRKAGVHFGWDFAPRLVTCGIWQDVGLRAWSVGRIEGVRVFQRSKPEGRELTFAVDLRATEKAKGELLVKLNGRLLQQAIVEHRNGVWTQEVVVQIPDTGRWWPRGSGPQTMHDLHVEWLVRNDRISSWERPIGLVTIALDQTPDKDGTPFTFRVNEVPTFMQGANLVPPDMFLPRAGDQAWVRLVQHMQAANMNMVRVWGGGVYPPDAFFQACDTAGILVWQDLMFANTMVPDDDAFLTNVQQEVLEQVTRIQHHPSLAMWCGNNEVEVAWHNWGWQQTYGMSQADSTRMWTAYRTLFEEVLPDRLWVLDRSHRYVPTSPISNWGNVEGLRHGDLHYWGVWHGDAPLEALTTNVGRFVSEYGFQSYPEMATLLEYASPEELAPGGVFWARRQRSYKSDKAIIDMAARYGMRVDDKEQLIRVSQELQARAYGLAIAAHKARQPFCMGTLLWQLNDIWPGPSWSIVDHAGRRKLAFDAVRKAYAPEPAAATPAHR